MTRSVLAFSPGAAGPVLSDGTDVLLPWQDSALCAEADPEAWFPEKGGSTKEAKKVCMACDVRAECLDYALERDERFGIWGGLSERERHRLKRNDGTIPSPQAITPYHLERFAALRAAGLTYAQIASQMGIVPQRVNTIARRARELGEKAA
jgi:WhiB family transcriptional regulator, redox-sensing transcriptional regulator